MHRFLITLTALLVAAVACGGASDGESTSQVGAESRSDLPAVDVLDVVTGETVDVASLAPLETPLLIWFYAPH